MTILYIIRSRTTKSHVPVLCARSTCKVAGLGFVDNVNILACGKSTEDNCRLLERIHRDCLTWGARHGAAFPPQKYELMHLTRSPKKFNMVASLRPPAGDKAPSPTVRILDVLLDTKLRWGPHIRRTSDRALQQSRALTAVSASTWGASFERARLVYNTVVRPSLTYGSTVWAPLEGTLRPANRQWIGEPLERVQQRCLRTVTGAFKATSRQALEKEAAVPPPPPAGAHRTPPATSTRPPGSNRGTPGNQHSLRSDPPTPRPTEGPPPHPRSHARQNKT